MEVILDTRKKQLFKGKASSLVLPGKEGIMQILPDHAPLLALLSAGDILIDSASGIKAFKILSGFAEVHGNKVTILAKV